MQVFEQGGEFVQPFGKDVLKSPSGVAMTKDGHVAVASEGTQQSLLLHNGRAVCP